MIFDRLRSLPTSGSIVIPRTAGIGATPPLADRKGRNPPNLAEETMWRDVRFSHCEQPGDRDGMLSRYAGHPPEPPTVPQMAAAHCEDARQ